AGFEPGEADLRQRRAGALEVAADRERDLLVGALLDEVAAGILGEVAGTAVAVGAPGLRLEQPRGELGERRLARAVRADERDDLAAAEAQARVLDDRQL